MRIRRHFRRRRGRTINRKGDWVVAAFDVCPDDHTLDVCGALSADRVFPLSMIDSDDVQAKDDSLTVVRTVGELQHSLVLSTSDTDANAAGRLVVNVRISEGMYVSTSDPNGNVTELDPSAGDAAESDSWMWRRTLVAHFAKVLPGGSLGEDWWSHADYVPALSPHLDLRVKRKVKFGEELVYVAHAAVQPITGSAGFLASPTGAFKWWTTFNLRMFVKF